MSNTAKKTATKKTATKTPVRATKIKTNKSQRKAKAEKPDLGKLNSPLFDTVIDNTEKLAAHAKTGLSYWKSIGDSIIEIRANWIAAGGDVKARGDASFKTYRETSPIGFMSKQDVSDAMLIAKNWAVVCKMDDTESLDAMGVSKCKKAISEAKKPKQQQGPSNKNTTKKNTKKTDAAIDLSSLMKDPASFGELIGKLVNSKYTDVQKKEYINAQAQCIIIKNLADAI